VSRCTVTNFDPSIRRHSGIWGAADEAVLNIERKKFKKSKKIPLLSFQNVSSVLCTVCLLFIKKYVNIPGQKPVWSSPGRPLLLSGHSWDLSPPADPEGRQCPVSSLHGIVLLQSPTRNVTWARICKRLWSPGIDSRESILPAYVAWRAGATNRVVVPALQAT